MPMHLQNPYKGLLYSLMDLHGRTMAIEITLRAMAEHLATIRSLTFIHAQDGITVKRITTAWEVLQKQTVTDIIDIKQGLSTVTSLTEDHGEAFETLQKAIEAAGFYVMRDIKTGKISGIEPKPSVD